MNDFDEIPTQDELNECMNEFFDNFEINSIIDEAELISSRNTVNEIENFIKKCYLNIINREPDENGLTHYTNMIKHNAILGNQLIEILNNSDECKNKQSQNNVHNVENVIDNIEHQINNDEIDDEIDNIMNEAELISSRNTINEIEDFVTKCYYTIMNREPDKGGLVNYTNKIKHNEILGVHLIEILKESDEYKRKQPQNNVHNIENVNINQNIKIVSDNEQEKINKEIEKMKNQKQIYDEKSNGEITYCMMGTNRLHEFKSYIEKAHSYVDKFIFIDGGSEDGTIEYLENLKNSELYENKIEVYVCPWQDKFSAQRNNYLDKLRERNYKGWVLVSDTDEHFTEETFKELRNLIEKAEKENYNGIKFQVEDVMTKDIDGNNKITKTLNEYWKGLLFRFYPDVKYKGEPHETLIGAHYEWMNTNFIYKHNRSQLKVYYRAVENFYISNSNRYSEKWADFRFLTTLSNLLNFNDFITAFKKGELSSDLEKWIIDHKDINEDSGDSEIREIYILYYDILHPDKLNDKKNVLQNNLIPNQSNIKINMNTTIDVPNEVEETIENDEYLRNIFYFNKSQCNHCNKITNLIDCIIDKKLTLSMCTECWMLLKETIEIQIIKK